MVRAIVEEMSTARLSKARQAATMPMEAVAYLEDLAVSSVSTYTMILAAAFRFAAGSSARIDDTKHVHISRRTFTEHTLEVVCFQSKVSGRTKSKQEFPLIAPLVSLSPSSSSWWTAFEKGQSLLDKVWLERGRGPTERDWMFPWVSSGGQTLRLRPATNQVLLAQFRSMISQRVHANAVLYEITLASLRVFSRTWHTRRTYRPPNARR